MQSRFRTAVPSWTQDSTGQLAINPLCLHILGAQHDPVALPFVVAFW
jgi:hypothetical protein